MKFSISTFLVIICFGLFMNLTFMEKSKIDFPQPSPLVLDNDSIFIIQPIIENIDIRGFEFIKNIKLYYKDKMSHAILFKKGEPLETYCSDSTIITLYPKIQQPIIIGSTKRMSCKILAIFSLSKTQSTLLKTYPLDSIKIYNYVTENKYVFSIKDKTYFSRLLSKYPTHN